MPSGSKIRSRITVGRSFPAARAMTTPSTCALVLYIQRSPGWYMRGSDPSARIQPSTSCGPGGQGGPPMLWSPSSVSACLDRIRAGRREHGAEAHAEREEIFERDRPPCRNRVVERGVDRAQHLPVRELGHELVDRVVEAERAVVHERQCGHRRDRLRERRDAEDRVAPEGRSVGERGRADHLDVDVVTARDQGDKSGQLPFVDVRSEEIVQAREPGA